ncbi:CoA transferase [Nitratireductor sp. StC3]|uniref:CaiB/BaiF CoA transferase family protein n=1 Tax=Nitratireductor sp. StC3 TaxID=2126741 RepID=UPI000D0E0354|nr:CoA transferase [Nitratireductor sp. StC3]PSM16405.1 formyl-CoA transferase [Nitratireductor sp. StC3]
MTNSDATQAIDGALTGLRVIEMGSFIAGPFCGQVLADLGAEVIKIEPPRRGDAMRQWGVETLNGRSLWWPVIARNKKSLTLDLRANAGREIARKLIGQADVLVENFRPGTLEKWDLAPARLMEANPKLVIGRVSGFGQTGPYSNRTGFGAIAEAMSGVRALCGFPDRPPPRMGLSVGDSVAGLFTCIGILSALHGRALTGKGQVVDVGITDAMLAMCESVLSEHGATGAVRERAGTGLPRIAPSNLYPTVDGKWLLIAANGDAIFERLTQAMARPELAGDPRFADHRSRGQHQALLDDIVAEWTKTLTRDALLARLNDCGVPAGPINDAADVCADPHFRERGAVIEVASETYGPVVMQGVVPRLSANPGRVRWVGPELGEHNVEILTQALGLSPDEVEALGKRGVV